MDIVKNHDVIVPRDGWVHLARNPVWKTHLLSGVVSPYHQGTALMHIRHTTGWSVCLRFLLQRRGPHHICCARSGVPAKRIGSNEAPGSGGRMGGFNFLVLRDNYVRK